VAKLGNNGVQPNRSLVQVNATIGISRVLGHFSKPFFNFLGHQKLFENWWYISLINAKWCRCI
jgi:hypothetical protein